LLPFGDVVSSLAAARTGAAALRRVPQASVVATAPVAGESADDCTRRWNWLSAASGAPMFALPLALPDASTVIGA